MQHFSKQLRTRLLTLYLSADWSWAGCPDAAVRIWKSQIQWQNPQLPLLQMPRMSSLFPAGRAGGVYRLCGAGGRHFR